MKNSTTSIAILLCSLLTLVSSLNAFASPDEHRFGVAASLWGMLDDMDQGATHVNYEFAELENFWGIRPTLMIQSNLDNKHYFSVGWLKEWDWQKYEKVSWGIGGQAGYFHNPGRLGYEVEFYTRILINYEIDEESMVRAEFGHISNAGFGDYNPGSENLAFTYMWRF